MPSSFRARTVVSLLALLVCAAGGTAQSTEAAQSTNAATPANGSASSPAPLAAPALHSLAALALRQEGPVLRQRVRADEPFTVAGPTGVLVGQQQGTLEAWLLPVKLLSHLSVEAQVAGYPVPLDLNNMAREIEVRPDRTTITFSHIALTVREILFAADAMPAGTGAVVLFQVEAVRPVELTLRFTPAMEPMWPEPTQGRPDAEWLPNTPGDDAGPGLYILHTYSTSLAGAVALPGATHGIMAPYQERPQTHPLELHLRIDPRRDAGRSFPLLMAVGQTAATASTAALTATLQRLDDQLPALYAAHVARVTADEQHLTSITTPDAALDADFGWAVTSIGQLRARLAPTPQQPSGELGLVAGYFSSGDSARPGFGWFFGRDALYTLYAVDSYGDLPLARTELEFLLRRQRADGKIMHEYSQTAASVDWAALPYEYAAADATPLFLTALLDYVRTSGDTAFLTAHQAEILKAWNFETTHDTDGDGIYDNAQGTGWVESWPGGMPHQEIYLALLDEQASTAMAQLATLLALPDVSTAAQARTTQIHAAINREYLLIPTHTYAFSRNAGGKLDEASTVFPAIAWWNGGKGLDHPDASLRLWASHSFDTDWGLRDVAATDPVYDPISYHQGSVWPLFTGWAAMAQYRSGHPLAGYAALEQNAEQTTTQDPGAVTELLSGAYFQPFGRSTSHQLWSSAMVVTPVLRGLFGIEVDALKKTVKVTPHLPADWNTAEVDHLHVGDDVVSLQFQRSSGVLVVKLLLAPGTPAGTVQLAGSADGTTLHLLLPAVEVWTAHALPLPGAATEQWKVLSESYGSHSLQLELEGQAGSEAVLHVRRNDSAAAVHAEGAEFSADLLHIHFPAGSGYVSQTVTLRW